MIGESIKVTRPTVGSGKDDLGNPIPGTPTSFTVDNVAVAPLTPQEEVELFGAVSKGGYTLYMPFGSDLRPADSVEVRGERGFQVWGDASKVQWESPFTGWHAGSVAVVRRGS